MGFQNPGKKSLLMVNRKTDLMPSLPAIKPVDPPPRPGPGGWNIWVAASQGDIPRVTVPSRPVQCVSYTAGISRFRNDS